MFTSSFIVSLLVLNLGFPADAKWIERILYGRRSDIPSVLLLRTYHDGLVTLCSSTLIKPQYILTAAHCNPGSYQRMTATYGCNDIESPNCREVDVVEFNVPEGYRQLPKKMYLDKNYYDIAIGKLAHPIDNIKPMSLPTRGQRLPKFSAIIVGWGQDERGISGQFQKSGKISIMNIPDTMKDKILFYRFPFGSFIADGDSGGPLLAKNTIFGVASSSVELEVCKNGQYCVAIYTSVIDNLDFIKKHTSST